MEKVTGNINGKLIDFSSKKNASLKKLPNQKKASSMLAKPLTATENSIKEADSKNPLGVKRSRYYQQKNAAINSTLAVSNDVTSAKALHKREVKLLNELEGLLDKKDKNQISKLQEQFATLQVERNQLARNIRSRNDDQSTGGRFSIRYGNQQIAQINLPHLQISNGSEYPEKLEDIAKLKNQIADEAEKLEQQGRQIAASVSQLTEASAIFSQAIREREANGDERFAPLRSEDQANLVTYRTAHSILQNDSNAAEVHDLSTFSESLLGKLLD